MNHKMRIQQLQKLIEMIDTAILGNDWESRLELKKIRSSAVEEIKKLQEES